MRAPGRPDPTATSAFRSLLSKSRVVEGCLGEWVQAAGGGAVDLNLRRMEVVRSVLVRGGRCPWVGAGFADE